MLPLALTAAAVALLLPLPPAAAVPAAPAAAPNSGSGPELYFLLFHQALNQTYNISAVDGLFARAAAAGYAGTILYDHNLEALGSPLLTPAYVPSL
eukprot:COSAG06_NODE_31277_length_524_cov_0.745882_2_plen_95_part_01